MNLIEERWIPVRRRSGLAGRIAPWELTDGFDSDPWFEVAAPRPDFDGALVQYLIGLLQTCFAPSDSTTWQARLSAPPSPEELRSTFSRVSQAFYLDGDGPRFLQDLTLEGDIALAVGGSSEDARRPIAELFIGAPTGKTIRDNTDHFVQRGTISELCPPCTAAALLTMQLNAPAGGQGNRTGIRGGGPLTTLVKGESLWATTWLNVLDAQTLHPRGDWSGKDALRTYPWLAPTVTSDDGRTVTPEDASLGQLFWAMPRRIRLLRSDRPGSCSVCGNLFLEGFREILSKNLGVNYGGPWKHPLSPHFVAPDGSPSPAHGKPDGLGYRHWLGIAISSVEENGTREAAEVVSRYLRVTGEDARIWAFGYDMDKMKARAWQDATMPAMACPAELRPLFEGQVAALVRASALVGFELRRRTREALFSGTESRGDLSFVTDRYWRETEAPFYRLLPRLRSALISGADVVGLLEEWLRVLAHTAETIFDDCGQSACFDVVDPRRVSLAWHNLRKGIYGKKVRESLGLAAPASETAKRKKKGTK